MDISYYYDEIVRTYACCHGLLHMPQWCPVYGQ